MIRAHLLISGVVQGVCFRAESKYQAQFLNLSGWVKNRYDGKVEIVAEGRRSEVERMVQWCKKGPAGAIVENVDVVWQEYTGEFEGFDIK
jgi:acylphosphatase